MCDCVYHYYVLTHTVFLGFVFFLLKDDESLIGSCSFGVCILIALARITQVSVFRSFRYLANISFFICL